MLLKAFVDSESAFRGKNLPAINLRKLYLETDSRADYEGFKFVNQGEGGGAQEGCFWNH